MRSIGELLVSLLLLLPVDVGKLGELVLWVRYLLSISALSLTQ